MSESTDPKLELPVEVSLVDKVKNCTDCEWFWGGIVPYGPFPVFDWKDDKFPDVIKDGPPASESKEPVKWCEVDQAGCKAVEPAILRGCRKAPMMTIGINPNMTAFFAGSKSASWTYPWFSDEATYAYYYRHATIYQESFSLDTLKPLIIEGTEIIAEHDGKVEITRNDSHRWMEFAFDYEGMDEKVYVERAWMPEERLVVFNVKYNADVDTVQAIEFKKGDLIAAKISPDDTGKTELYANKVDYYERLLPVLGTFNSYLGEQGFSKCKLTMGEDVSMHDMIGCASPGWNKKRYDMPIERIADNCVKKNRYMLDQLFQSRPRLVFIVSNSSLTMFADGFTAAGGDIDLNFESRDVFDLMAETCQQRRFISWKEGDEEFGSRIIVTPHFSYGDNFDPQSRFSSEAWEIFRHQYPVDFEVLDKAERIKSLDGASFMSVMVKREDDAIEDKISAKAWQLLMDYHYEPYALLSDALITEQETFPLITDKSAGHLDRAPGGCSFCVNQRWEFTEGCDYGLA